MRDPQTLRLYRPNTPVEPRTLPQDVAEVVKIGILGLLVYCIVVLLLTL